MGTWTEASAEQLATLYNDGLSASQIASKLGVSRNAVCGKLHRMGLKRAKPVRDPNEIRARKKKAGPRVILRIVASNGQVYRAPADWPIPAPSVVEAPRNLALIDLESSDCRYPLGEGPFTYCGHPKLEGSSYCPAHHALCWVPPTSRNLKSRGQR